jgi:hypothetical protein
VRDAPLAFRPRQFKQTELYIALDGEPWKNAALLKNKDTARVGPTYYLTIDPDFSASRRQEPRHGTEQCRLTAPGRSYNAEKLSFADFETDIVQYSGALAIARKYHVDVLRGQLRIQRPGRIDSFR